MRVDFYVPCSVTGSSSRLNQDIEYNGTLATLVDEIERQLSVDFCEDFAEFMTSEEITKLGYNVYSSCIHMTVYKDKLYVRISAYVKLPQYQNKVLLSKGQHMDIPYDDVRDFKKFVDLCIREINGQMSDGWGEGFEQRKITLSDDPNDRFYPHPSDVEFVSWDGYAVDNRGNMMHPVIYNQKSKLFEHGWLMGGWDGLDIFVSRIYANANIYNSLVIRPNAWRKREVKRIMRDITRFDSKDEFLDKVFIYKFISWYIKRMKLVGRHDKEAVKRLRAYQKLFK